MSIDDAARLHLHRIRESVLGPEGASTLMSHLPPVTWHHVATKDDLAVLETRLRAEISVSASGLRTEMADLRTEMAIMRSDPAGSITRQTRWMLAVALTRGSVLVATARLLP